MDTGPEFYKAILDQLCDGIYFVDQDRAITYWNKGAERITGYAADAVLGRRCPDNLLMHVDELGDRLCNCSRCPFRQTMDDGAPREVSLFLRHAGGHRVPVLVRTSPLHGPQGDVVGAVQTFSDNSSMLPAIRRANELDTDAFRDPLTGVGNRALLEVKIESSLAEIRRNGLPAALVLVDIDRLTGVNEREGRDTGDRVLAMVARTLAGNVRASDLVGRWGSDEFAIVLRNMSGPDLAAVADKLRNLVASSSLATGERKLQVTVSMGATGMLPQDTVSTLILRADWFMHKSKQSGRSRVTSDA